MNFALILFVLVVLTGVAWVADKLIFLPQRRRAADAAVAEFDRQQARVGERFADENAPQTRARLRDEKLRQPWWLEYTASFFPVILVVFLVRSFLVEPFHIPSSSMVPTLLVGDFILVNKYDYGLRVPVLRSKLLPIGEPKRGDVVVFHFPEETAGAFCMASPECALDEVRRSAGTDFIKRVVGLPGDHIVYRNKTLYINGVQMVRQELGPYAGPDASGLELSREHLGDAVHQTLADSVLNSREGEWTVPEGE